MHRARVALELPSQYDLDSIWNRDHIQQVAWTVLLHSDFDAELAALDELLQDELLAHARLLAEFGPHLGRPIVDTLKGSRHPNMKELRFGWQGGAWHSHSIHSARRFCWSGATKEGRTRSVFIAV